MPVPRIVVDHVAHAVASHRDVLGRYAGDLGARFHGFGEGPGFSPMQVRFANDAKVEILRPHAPEQFPFLQRFLDHRGPGLHHVTFKVPDIEAVMADAQATGHTLVDVNLEWDEWKEAFVHPKSAHGFLVQLAQAAAEMPGTPPATYPEAEHTVDLLRLVLAVADLDAALVLYGSVLGGEVAGRGDEAGPWADVHVGSAMLIRLWQPVDTAVLAGANGRAEHLEVAVDDPSVVPAAVGRGASGWEIPAAANHGTRVRLLPR